MYNNPPPPLLSPPVEPSFTGYETLFSVANFVNGNTNPGDVALGGGGNNNGNRGSIAERRGAKCGFRLQTERINTPRFRTTSPLPSPSAAPVRSPYITIPPGISPTALLDSPIMLPNSQSSPTTGSFPLLDLKFKSSLVNTVASGDGNRSSNTSLSFTFKPYRDSDSLQEFSPENQGNDLEFQDTDSMEPLMDFEYPIEFSKETSGNQCISDLVTDVNILDRMTRNGNASDVQVNCSDVASNPISIQRETTHGDNAETHHHLEEYEGKYEGTLPASIGRTSEDGYNWRKYGQKQVKASEYPRSYYKCTHPNCQVKKKIERAHDGQMTEIIYKGAHNHPKPQTSGEAPPGTASSIDEMLEMDEGENFVKVEGGSIWKNTESGSKDIKVYSDWRADGLERTSSTSVVTELSDPLSTTLVKSVGTFESTETPELSSTLASHEDDDGVTQRSSFGADTDDESESKGRKIERCVLETNMESRAVREPRVVVQIESPDLEILDDGYRWRKYGQKVVKGNPNPRSYYKCTSAGCSVRKHVERAAHNVKYVITTYEGKHNHEVPAARNSSHVNSTSSNLTQNTANAQPSITLARNASGPNPGTQIFAPSFEKNPVFNNDYLRSNFPRNFSNEMNLGSSVYPTKFPPLQTTVPYHFCRFNNDQLATSHSGSVASLVPDFPGSLPSSCLQTAANLSLPGVDFSSNAKRVRQVQTFLLGQQLMSPTQEQKDDNLSSSGASVMDHLNASSSMSTIYNQLLGRF